MPPRKYPSGCEKRKKKQKVEALVNTQRGAIEKFLSSNKKIGSTVEKNENLVNEVAENLVNEEEKCGDNLPKKNCGDMGSEEAYQSMKKSENGTLSGINQNEGLNVECAPSNIDDPSNWGKIDQKLRDLLVERGPIRRDGDVNFRKDEKGRHLSSVHYIRHQPNGEKYDRKWLVYLEALNRVFCFCCKLFKQEGNKTQLANEGFKDWRNIGDRLKGHERSSEHLTCVIKWIELKRRLEKNQTIDKSVQEQIEKEREH